MSAEPLTYDVILDFDDVLYPFTDGVMEVLVSEGVDAGRKITQWKMHKDFGLTRDEFWDMMYLDRNFSTLYDRPISEWTVRQLGRLTDAGHRLHVVTARGEVAQGKVFDQMRAAGIAFDSIHFAKDKGLMVDILDASFSIDDAPHNYLDLDRDRHLTYLMRRPHNADFIANNPLVRGVGNLQEFVNTVLRFQGLGVRLRDRQAA